MYHWARLHVLRETSVYTTCAHIRALRQTQAFKKFGKEKEVIVDPCDSEEPTL